MTAVPVEQLADPVWALIDAIPNVNAFDGEVTDPPLDADGRVHAYTVYYPSPGWAHALLACGGTDSLDWSFQVTCVGGDRTRALWCLGKVRAALSGQRLTIAGQGLLIHETSNPGPVRRDDDISPPRFWFPLLFAMNA